MYIFSKIKSASKGFTLVELMVVIAIIGLLATIITVSLTSSKAKGRDAKRVADIKTLQLALETYYNDNSAYPITLAPLAPTYLPSLPVDPSGGTCVNGNEGGCYFYNSLGANGANCGSLGAPSATNPIVKYHLGAAMESNELNNTQTFSQDIDYSIAAPYSQCTSGGGRTASFLGKSNGCTTTAGSGITETCYDVTN